MTLKPCIQCGQPSDRTRCPDHRPRTPATTEPADTTQPGTACPNAPAGCNPSARTAEPPTTSSATTHHKRGNARPAAKPSASRTSTSSAAHATGAAELPDPARPGRYPERPLQSPSGKAQGRYTRDGPTRTLPCRAPGRRRSLSIRGDSATALRLSPSGASREGQHAGFLRDFEFLSDAGVSVDDCAVCAGDREFHARSLS